MSSITDKMHEIYGLMQTEKDKMESIIYRIQEIEKEGSEVEARLQLEINRNKRGTSYYFLSKEEVLRVLNNSLNESNNKLMELQKEYNSLQ